MSVQIIEEKIFDKLVNKMIDYTFRKQVDINYCSTAGRLTENQIKETVRYWSILNEISYMGRYKEGHFENLHELIDFRYRGKSPDTYQSLKWLECVQYNIETSSLKGTLIGKNMNLDELRGWDSSVLIPNPLTTLNSMIEEIKSMIIKQIPEYENAKWNTID